MQNLAGFDAALKDVHREGSKVPISQYFKGRGTEVMKDMKKRYGPRAEHVFHATAAKTGLKPGRHSKADVKKSMKEVMRGRGGKR